MKNFTNHNKSDSNDALTYNFRNPSVPIEERVCDLAGRLTLEEKIELMCQTQEAVERLGIRAYKHGTEAAHGVSWLGKATAYPQPVGLACTWDKELLNEIGVAIGDEARAFYKRDPEKNGLTLWCPTVDLARDPRWGRTEETYGEDPCLTGEMTAALVSGIQGEHPVYLKAVATLKHFFANNNEIDRGRSSSVISPRNMKEYYWKAFKSPIVKGGAKSIMTSYNSINGRPAVLNSDVIEVVKKEWGMNGFVVSDAADVLGIVDDHHYYSSHARAVAEAIKSGIDSITDDPERTKNAIREALSTGLLSEEDLNNALKNTFRVRMMLGEFDPDEMNPYTQISEDVICCEKHRSLAFEASKKSIVLLKNENNTLPLNKDKTSKLAVIGPLGNSLFRDWYSGTYPYYVTPFEGIKNKLGQEKVVFEDGCDTITIRSVANGKSLNVQGDDKNTIAANVEKDNGGIFQYIDWGWGSYTLKALSNGKFLESEEKVSASADELYGWFVKGCFNFIPQDGGSFAITTWDGKLAGLSDTGELVVKDTPYVTANEKFTREVVKDGLKSAVEAAKTAESAVVFVGSNPMINGRETQDRYGITLPPSQEELVKAVYKANPNTIVVIVGSYPISIDWADENIPAIIYVPNGGQELGNAVADVLFGDYSPAGRLNMTWFKSDTELPDIMDYDIINSNRTYMYFKGKTLYPFGHGLTYTTFEYGNLVLNLPKIAEDGCVNISVDVKNTGAFASDEVVQLYVHAQKSRIKRPIKELKAFERIHLEPDETRTVKFTLYGSDLAIYDVTREKYCVEAGIYDIHIGRSSEDLLVSGQFEIMGETIPPRDLSLRTKAENYDDCFRARIDECIEGGNCVAFTSEWDYICFKAVDFKTGAGYFEVRLAEASENCSIDVRLDSPYGQLVGSVNNIPSSGKQVWNTFKASLRGAIGLRDVYIRNSGTVKISWFRFIDDRSDNI